MQKVTIYFIFLILGNLGIAQQTHYNVTAGNGNGLRLWNNDAYKIHMGKGTEYAYGPVTDYSIKTNMNGTPGRGWTWGIYGQVPVAGLNNAGDFRIAGVFTADGINLYNDEEGNNVGSLIAYNDGIALNAIADNLDIRSGHNLSIVASETSFRSDYVSFTGNEFGINVSDNLYFTAEEIDLKGAVKMNDRITLDNGGMVSTMGYTGDETDFIFKSNAEDFHIEGEEYLNIDAGSELNLRSELTSLYGTSETSIGSKDQTYISSSEQVKVWSKVIDLTATEALEIDSDLTHFSGNVGIGTSSPAEKLHINGSVRGHIGTGAIRVQTSSGYLDLGALNANWAHIYTDRPKVIFNKDVYTTSNAFSSYNNDLILKTKGTERLRINDDTGNVGIGTTSPQNKLSVNGTIWAKEVKVSLTDAADWVFEEDYKLRPLKEVAHFIQENKHLPEIPSAEEFRKNDLNVSEMTNKLLQKIEELTLYTIAQEEQIEEQHKKLEEMESLKARLAKLETLLLNN